MNLAFEQPFQMAQENAPLTARLLGGTDAGEFFTINTVSTPRIVPPGATLPVEVEWGADPDIANRIDRDSTNFCDPSSIFTPPTFGGIMFSRATFDGVTDSGSAECWSIADQFGQPDTIVSTRELPIPTQEGQYELLVEVVGGVDGVTYDQQTFTILVDDEAQDPDIPDNGNGNGGCLIGDPLGDACLVPAPSGSTIGIVALVVLILLLLGVAILS